MLDKEIVNFTRNGIVKTNLTTGKSELVVKSDYANEMKYKPTSEGVYDVDVPPHLHAEDYSREEGIPRNKQQLPTNSTIKYSPGNTCHSHTHTYFRQNSRYSNGVIHNQGHTSSSPGKNMKQITAKAEPALNALPASKTDFKKQIKNEKFRKLALYCASSLLGQENNNGDNPAVEAVKTNLRTIYLARQFKSTGKNSDNRRPSNTAQKPESIPPQPSSSEPVNQAQKIKFKKKGKAAESTRKTVAGGGTAKKLSILKHPAILKILLIAFGIFMAIVMLLAVIGGVLGSIFGGAQKENSPELTAYVKQLDDDFTAKISSVKENYENGEHTEVTVQGSDVINTDPEALAILVTGDWTDIALTDENKAAIKSYYNILNTYTVKESDSKVNVSNGTSSSAAYTEHHVTIIINTSTAADKIDSFNFSKDKKEAIIESLGVLSQAESLGAENGGFVGSGSGEAATPEEAYDDPQVKKIFTEADKYLGYKYVWGGSTPKTSFDCSGFVCWVFTHSGVRNTPRTSAQGLYDECAPMAQAEAQPGDLIFFTKTYPTSNTVTHVGIYAGNNKMLHCGDPIQYTTLNKTYWKEHFYSFGRLK